MNSTRWSFSSLGAHEMSLAELVALAKAQGMAGIELRTAGGSVDMPTVIDAFPGGVAGFRDHAAAAGVAISGLDTSFKLVGWNDGDWATLRRWAETGEALGAASLRVFDGGQPGVMPSATELESAARFLATWRDLRRKEGWKVDVAIETHDCLVTAEARRAMRAITGPLPLLWDTHHTWKKGGEDPLSTWTEIATETLLIHIKDSVSVPSARHPFTYVKPGEGEFPARPLLDVLAAAKFGGWMVFEWERQWHPYLVPVAEAIPSLAVAGWRPS